MHVEVSSDCASPQWVGHTDRIKHQFAHHVALFTVLVPISCDKNLVARGFSDAKQIKRVHYCEGTFTLEGNPSIRTIVHYIKNIKGNRP